MKLKLTPQTVLIANKDFMLLQRGSEFIGSNLDVSKAPTPLQPMHILLLREFLAPTNAVQGCQQFARAPLTAQLMGQLPEQLILQRLAELVSSGLLIEALHDTKKLPQYEIVALSPRQEFEQSGHYKVHRNLAIEFDTEGFLANINGENQRFRLGVDELFSLLSVAMAGNLDTSLQYKAPHIDVTTHWQSINRLKNANILIKKSPRSSPIENNGPKITVRDWRDVTPQAGKIPIYFVPHTENHYPLALGLIYTAVHNYNDGTLLQHFQLVPIVYLSTEEFLAGPYRKFGPGVWLFSNYIWSIDSNMIMSRFIKQDSERNLTIHGGPSTPDYPESSEEFFSHHDSVDIAVHAEGEVAICEILDSLVISENRVNYQADSLSHIKGISYRDYQKESRGVAHTDSRTRMSDPNIIPSPYMSGVFDYYAEQVEAAIIETNRGCPFGCTFCDWGSAINQKVRRFDMARVKQEITWVAENKTRVLWIADANFGMLDRDVEVADYIIEMKQKYGFPQEVVVNYTKNTTTRLVDIIKIFTEGGIISQGVISIQTMDSQTLEVIDRKNIKLDKYDELRKIFSEMKLPLSTDLMLGLPGTNIEALKSDLQHYIDTDVPVKAYPTQLLPNSPMADPNYLKKYQIETYDDGYLKSTFSYTEDDLKQMKQLYKIFTMADGYGLLRYVIRFLQWDYGIRAIDFLYELMINGQKYPMQYPRLSFAMKFFESDKCMPGGWRAFYDELHNYILNHYAVNDDSALQTILKVNCAVMPDESICYPKKLPLEHDVVDYFTDHLDIQNENAQSLSTYEPGVINISDPDGMVEIDDSYLQYDSHQFFWELTSEVSRIRSAFTM